MSKQRRNKIGNPVDRFWPHMLRVLVETSARAPIFHVPHPRNPCFTGRESLLQALDHEFARGRPVVLTQDRRHAGAMGKTQVALEYAYRNRARAPLTFWLRASDRILLAADFARLAGALGVPDIAMLDQQALCDSLRRFLGQNREETRDFLLIFDDARDAEDVRAYLPAEGVGKVLITTRSGNFDGLAQPRYLHALRSESILILNQRTGKRYRSLRDDLVAPLCEVPLAMDLAGAYIREQRITLPRYAELLSELGPRDGLPPNAAENQAVALSFELTHRELSRSAPLSAALIDLCAFLAPFEIPRDLFLPEVLAHAALPLDRERRREGAPRDPDLLLLIAHACGSAARLGEALALLERYALIAQAGDLIFVQQMVQAAARHRMSIEERALWVRAALRVVATQAFAPQRAHRPQDEVSRLFSHVQHVSQHAAVLEVEPRLTVEVLRMTGKQLQRHLRYPQARAVLLPAMQIAERVHGGQSPRFALSLMELGIIHMLMSEPEEARPLLARAVKIAEHSFGEDHPKVAYPLANLGSVLAQLGDVPGAVEHLDRALRLFHMSLGEEHPISMQVRDQLIRLRGAVG